MSEAATKTAGKAEAPKAQRRPMRQAVGPDHLSAMDSMRVLQGRAGNHAMAQALGRGMPLPPDVRSEMEARFGTDFGEVRIHDDAQAHANATGLAAKAYTQGDHIVFNTHRFAPHHTEGK